MNSELMLFTRFLSMEKTQTSIKELAVIWQCTERHAKTKIQALQQEQKVIWETQQGRGKKPYITLLRDKIDVLIEVMQELWQKNKYEEATELAKDFELLQHPKVQEWLTVQFGLKQINNEHVYRQPMNYVELCLDPLNSLSRHDTHMIEQIHESLYRIDENGNAVKNLLFDAVTGDYCEWTFILRKGIYFHHLQEMQAKDVVVSLRQAAGTYNHSFEIEVLHAVNDYEVYVRLNHPFVLLPHFLASTRFSILPENREPLIGCGPFFITEHSESMLTLQTFTHYFKERPWIDRVEIVYQNDFTFDSIRYAPFTDDIPSRKLVNKELGGEYIAINSNSDQLQSLESRAYLWHMIDPALYVYETRYEEVAKGWMRRQVAFKMPEYDEAPHFSRPLRIGYQQIREGVSHLYKAEILQKQLKNIGIDSTFVCINFKEKNWSLVETLDLFIGGLVISENKWLSLIYTYLAEPKIFLRFLTEDARRSVHQQIQHVSENPLNDQLFDPVEQFLQENATLKFLTHRQQIYYIREDSAYKHLRVDNNGRINYRKMYFAKSK